MSSPIRLPDLFCPFPVEVHPAASEVEHHAVEWMMQYRLIADPVEQDRFKASRIGLLAAMTHPKSDEEFLAVISDWMVWLFAFDDAYSEESEAGRDPGDLVRRFVPFLRILDGSESPDTSSGCFAESLRDLRLRLECRADPVQIERFAQAVRNYFLAQVWESSYRADGAWPSVHDYLSMRVDSGAVPTLFALIDVCGGFTVGTGELAHPSVRRLTRAAVNVVCWANDLYSYNKETERSEHALNLPTLVVRQGRTVPAALAHVAGMHDTEVRTFLGLTQELDHGASSELKRYIAGLVSWIAGNHAWSTSTARYQ